MPCRDYSDIPVYNYVESSSSKKQRDMLARIACRALTALEEVDPKNAVFKNKELKTWWTQHKKDDAKAAAEKKKNREMAAAKKKAKAKLTAEELKLLGIK